MAISLWCCSNKQKKHLFRGAFFIPEKYRGRFCLAVNSRKIVKEWPVRVTLSFYIQYSFFAFQQILKPWEKGRGQENLRCSRLHSFKMLSRILNCFDELRSLLTPPQKNNEPHQRYDSWILAETARFELAGDCSLTDFESSVKKRTWRNLTEDKGNSENPENPDVFRVISIIISKNTVKIKV